LGRLYAVAFAAAVLAVAAPAGVAAAQEQSTGGAAPPPPPAGAQAPVEGMPAVPYATEIAAAADANGVDRLLLAGLVRAESNFRADAGSRAGARGLTQLMPGTARSLGLRVDLRRKIDDRIVPEKALDAGARYLKAQLVRFRRVTLALAAYNAGPRPVIRYRRVPPYRETQAYVKKVVAYRNEYRAQLAAAREG
jgi:soluble lytic murein transglycosylase-like protein